MNVCGKLGDYFGIIILVDLDAFNYNSDFYFSSCQLNF